MFEGSIGQTWEIFEWLGHLKLGGRWGAGEEIQNKRLKFQILGCNYTVMGEKLYPKKVKRFSNRLIQNRLRDLWIAEESKKMI